MQRQGAAGDAAVDAVALEVPAPRTVGASQRQPDAGREVRARREERGTDGATPGIAVRALDTGPSPISLPARTVNV